MEAAPTYSCEALQEHQSKANSHTISYALLEKLLELRLLAHAISATLLYLCADLAHLMLDIGVRRVKITKLCQDLFSSFKIVATGQPSGILLVLKFKFCVVNIHLPWALWAPGDT